MSHPEEDVQCQADPEFQEEEGFAEPGAVPAQAAALRHSQPQAVPELPVAKLSNLFNVTSFKFQQPVLRLNLFTEQLLSFFGLLLPSGRHHHLLILGEDCLQKLKSLKQIF